MAVGQHHPHPVARAASIINITNSCATTLIIFAAGVRKTEILWVVVFFIFVVVRIWVKFKDVASHGYMV